MTAPIGCLDGEQAIRDALAAGPTLGTWTGEEISPEDPEWGASEVWAGDEVVATHVCGIKNAKYIAACNPETMRALLAELDRLRSASRQEGEASALNACLAACDRVIEYGGIFEGIDFHALKKGIERALSASEMREADGWQFVPTTPTDAMTFAGQQARYPVTNSITVIYRAMLAAAPHQAQEAQGDRHGE